VTNTDLPPRRWGTLLREMRQIRGLSAAQAARQWHIPASTLLAIEVGERRPPTAPQAVLANQLGHPTAQEHTLWELLYADRAAVMRLAANLYVAIAREWGRSSSSPARHLTWVIDELWPRQQPDVKVENVILEAKLDTSAAHSWLARRPEGVTVDWLLAATDAVRYDWDAQAVRHDAWIVPEEAPTASAYLGARVRYPVDGVKPWVFVSYALRQ
jgi:DNA-binding XRE family transcriptional regulator